MRQYLMCAPIKGGSTWQLWNTSPAYRKAKQAVEHAVGEADLVVQKLAVTHRARAADRQDRRTHLERQKD